MQQTPTTLRRPGDSPVGPVPRCTARAVRRTSPAAGHLAVGDSLGLLLADIDLRRLYPDRTPAMRPELLAVAVALQHAERLDDEAAAAAVAERVEWRYALHQPLDRPAPSPGELAEFRRRLAADEQACRTFEVLLRRLQAIGLLRRSVTPQQILQRLDG